MNAGFEIPMIFDQFTSRILVTLKLARFDMINVALPGGHPRAGRRWQNEEWIPGPVISDNLQYPHG